MVNNYELTNANYYYQTHHVAYLLVGLRKLNCCDRIRRMDESLRWPTWRFFTEMKFYDDGNANHVEFEFPMLVSPFRNVVG